MSSPIDVAFWSLFTFYLVGCLVILGQGALAALAAGSPALHEALHVQGLDSDAFARVATRAADASHDVPSGLQVVVDTMFSLTHLGLAAVLLWLRPRDWGARLLATAFVGAAGVFNLTAQAAFEQLPLTGTESVAQAGAHTVAGLAYVYALLLFPDGRAVPHRSRRVVVPLYLVVTVAVIDLSVQVEGSTRPATLLLFFGVLVPIVGAAAQGYRIRHTEDVTGQAQARLLFWALLPSVVFGLLFLASHGLATTTTALAGRHLPEPPVTLYRYFQPAFALIPLALFAGILRFRLWDIERLLSRTIVYAAATGVLGGAYLLFVLVLQQVLGRVAATPIIESPIVVAITTLVLASVFRPVRDRVQRLVDQRFHRARYDAQLTVEQFARQLRDEVEPERIARELLAVLDQVIEPEHAWLWLDPSARPAPKALATDRTARAETDHPQIIGQG
ncbi:MAG: hypothetical protein WEB09_02395 [Nitriliruptor sp.]